MICPTCQRANIALAHFCGHCGTALGATSAASSVPRPPRFFERLGDKVSRITGVPAVEDFRPAEMFSAVLTPRTETEIEDYFTCGTAGTTPPLEAVQATWPKPWLFFKVFSIAVTAYLGLLFAWGHFGNPKLLAGLMTVGAFAVPLSVVIFYFETNVTRNVSPYQIVRLVLIGGVFSIVASLFGYQVVDLNWLGASQAGVIEETGKLLALIAVVRNRKYVWTLNGLLVGGAVGAGFAAFETAGYALEALGSNGAMLSTILFRGLLAPGGHVAWTALVAAALWRVKADRPFSALMLFDPRFLRVFGLAVGLHMVWNSPLQLPLFGTQILLSLAAWAAILAFVEDGLKQVQQAQTQIRRE